MERSLTSPAVVAFRSRVFALLAISALLLATGCDLRVAGGAPASAASGPSAGAAPGDPLKVVAPDGSTRSLSLKEMDALPKGRIEVEGKWEEGPTLPDVLASAGVKEFKQVTILGAEGAKLTLTKEQVNREVVLDFTNHGTVKFSSPAVPKKDWIKDISTLRVE